MLRSFLVGIVSAALCWAPVAQACTGIRLIAKDRGVVAARTLEFGFDLHSEVLVVPAGTTLSGTLPGGGKGISYKSKYGFLGANAEGLTAIVDGINERGLYVGLFYFPGYASYPEATKDNAARAMAPHEYANWLLGNFSSVEEVKANFNNVVLVPTLLEAIEAPAPVHFVVHDASGAAVVIEPLGKTLKIYDNPLGVVTNSPTFDWHMTNLRNYVNLTVDNVPPVDLGGIKLAQFGQGSGLRGLPGDFTPPSRFVRAVAFSKTSLPAEKAKDGVLQAFHILNQFDIPKGAARGIEHGKEVSDYTLWTSAADLKNLRYYFRTFDNSRIRMVDMKAVGLDATGIRTISMKGEEQIEDVSGKAK